MNRLGTAHCCLDKQIVRETPIEDVEGFAPVGLSVTVSEDGPDLSSIVEFFGLDARQTAALGEALKQFGQQMGAIESATEQVEYLGDGSMRISFPEGEGAKASAFRNLEQNLQASLGPKTAERLWALSSLEKMASRGSSDIEARISISGEWLTAGLPDQSKIVFPRPKGNGSNKRFSTLSLESGFGGRGLLRISHLQHQIDWGKLYTEAEKQAGK